MCYLLFLCNYLQKHLNLNPTTFLKKNFKIIFAVEIGTGVPDDLPKITYANLQTHSKCDKNITIYIDEKLSLCL